MLDLYGSWLDLPLPQECGSVARRRAGADSGEGRGAAILAGDGPGKSDGETALRGCRFSNIDIRSWGGRIFNRVRETRG